MNTKISIPKGNIKMGDIPNISLPPGVSCKANVPCFDKCYVIKAYARWPSVRRAWDRNFACYKKDPADFFTQINSYLTRSMPAYFRWHVAGDIPDQLYLDGMISTAQINETTAFLCFTKQFGFDFSDLKSAPNLKMIFSRWPGDVCDTDLGNEIGMAWMQDGTETRIPGNAFKCAGTCDNCFHCWSMAGKQHVYFNLH